MGTTSSSALYCVPTSPPRTAVQLPYTLAPSRTAKQTHTPRMRSVAASSLLLALGTAASAVAQNLTLAQEYTGATFFDAWTFNASVIDNTTYGNIHYLSREASTASQLTYVNAAGNAIIKVDNTTSGANDPTFGRDSIKLVSNASFALGTLYIVDAVHLPYGCSVWPAIWTLSSVTKDDEGGEVDIWEGVNNDLRAQYTLHTKDGCTQSNNTAFPYDQASNVVSTNCDYKVNGNQGCQFRENSTASYGAEFATNGGGVFASLWDGNGIQTWFFPRASIPADIAAGTPDPSTWGTPSAAWPSTTCDMEEYFTEQNIIINITLCGAWAGSAPVFAQTCSGLCTDYIAEPSNFDTAYFEISSIKAYTGASTTRTITAATQINSTTIASTGNGVSSAGSGQGTGDAAHGSSLAHGLAAGAAALAIAAAL